MNSIIKARSQGFTIVELIIVIVVIGILATITIISYNGIADKAISSSLKSDLANASKQLELYKATNGNYPSDESQVDNGKGLPKSNGAEYQYTLIGDDYYLSINSDRSDNVAYYISSETGSIADGVWSGHIPPGGSLVWSQYASDVEHTCAIDSNSKAYCWGDNANGQLGNNSFSNSLTPVAVDTSGVLAGKTIKSISTDYFHTCVVASDDMAYCWGYNDYGVLGNGLTSDSSVPVAVDTSGVLAGKTIKSIATGGIHACAIASDDQAYCWGWNNYGQLGNNSTSSSSVPVAVYTGGVLSGKTVKAIAAGDQFTCAIASDNQVYCWGVNTYGELGINASGSRSVPTAVYTGGVLSGKTVKSLAVADNHACVIASDDQAYCWGWNTYGNVGDNSTSHRNSPVAVYTGGVLSGKTVKSIDSGGYFSCVIASDDQLYCWGYNGTYGSLGNNSTTQSSVPVSVETSGVLSGKTVKSISAGEYHSCGLTIDNVPFCWGYNGSGQLGTNDTNNSRVPVATFAPPI